MKRLMSILLTLCMVLTISAAPASAATLSAPTNLKVTVSSTTVKVSLSWKAVLGATGYQINVTDKASGTVKKYNVSKTSTSLSDKELSAGKSYTVAVRAYVKSNGKTTYGNYTSGKAIETAAKTTTPSTPIYTDSGIAYTDGNIYIQTDDHHYIIKIDPKFKGYEIMFESTNAELYYPPITGIKAYFTGRTTNGVKTDVTDKLTFVYSPEGIKETDITLIPGKTIPKKLLTLVQELGYEDTSGKASRLIEVRYGGVTVNTYWIDISDGIAEAEEEEKQAKNAAKVGEEIEAGDSRLADGDYYLQIYGKYLYPVYASGDYWVELSDQVPDYPFTVKLAYEDTERGPAYDITYNDGAAWSVYNQGDQLRFGRGGVDSSSPKWRINKYSSFCTIRDYRNQKLVVNTNGQKSDNGTKVIVWPHTGSAPDNAKIKVYYAK